MRSNHFHGIQTWQNPFDVWVTQEIIFEVKPDLILETGTFRGGSSLMWAMYLEQVSPDGRVITIDIKDKRVPRSKTHPLAAKVDFLLGSSTASDVVADVKRRAKGKRVLIILDSLQRKIMLPTSWPTTRISSRLVATSSSRTRRSVQSTRSTSSLPRMTRSKSTSRGSGCSTPSISTGF
jgi:hypothetical protein